MSCIFKEVLLCELTIAKGIGDSKEIKSVEWLLSRTTLKTSGIVVLITEWAQELLITRMHGKNSTKKQSQKGNAATFPCPETF